MITKIRSIGILMLLFVWFIPFIHESAPVASAACFLGVGNCDEEKVPYCRDWDSCGIQHGADIVKNNILDIEKDRGFVEYIQDIVGYLLGFLALVGVLYLIYAGLSLIFGAGSEEHSKKLRKTIFGIIIGILLIFLAYPIVMFIIRAVSPDSTSTSGSGTTGFFRLFSPEITYAADVNQTFDDYRKQIEKFVPVIQREYKLNGAISISTLDQLRVLVEWSVTTLPDDIDMSLPQNLLIAIDGVKKSPDSETRINELAKSLNEYFAKIPVKRISWTINANPKSGNSPLVTTLSVLDVLDPSGTPIPQNNFIWWIRTANGGQNIIGRWSRIVATFKEENTYIVNLQVNSASRNSKGKTDVLPLLSSINVAVEPKVVDLNITINGYNVTNQDEVKITPAIAKSWLVIDATGSRPLRGTRFLKTYFDFGNGNRTTYNNEPRIERQVYANEGTYKFEMILTTNEWKELKKSITLIVKDPVSSIQVDHTTGYVGETFQFDSPSIVSGANFSYSWEIQDLSNNNKVIYTAHSRGIKRTFDRVGAYKVLLNVTSPAWQIDDDSVIITIDPKDPIAAFNYRAASSETPNLFVFDATRSYDIDNASNTKLNFLWKVDGERVDLIESQRNGAIGKYQFTTLGTHTVTLDVTNSAEKMSSVSHDVLVESLLSVKMRSSPRIGRVGESMEFFADSKEAGTFEWNFNDGTPNQISQNGRVSHIFKRTGSFDVSLTVRSKDTVKANTISRKAFVADTNAPFSLISVRYVNQDLLPTPDQCSGNEAFVVDRVSPVTFSSEDSINLDGLKQGLSYAWKIGTKTSFSPDFSYKFDELGCFPVSLTVRSDKNGATNTNTAWIRVVNIAPKIASLSVSAENLQNDPVVVTVSANGAVDEDGVITQYVWYYFTDSDPEPQDFRITRLPKTIFVLPKITGKYYFVLSVEDSNGVKVSTMDNQDEQYSITLASDNINTPLLTVTTSNTLIGVGQEVQFRVSAKNILGNDISSKSEYKWDFDGDGFYDQTTNTPTVSYVYPKAGSYNFKVKAVYKWLSNTRYQLISVQNNLNAEMEPLVIGSKVILFNTSRGSFSQADWNIGSIHDTTALDYLVSDFSGSTFPSKATLTISDGKVSSQADIAIFRDTENAWKIETASGSVIVFTHPASSGKIIHLRSADQKLFFYFPQKAASGSLYRIDIDTTTDSDLNGVVSDDNDTKMPISDIVLFSGIKPSKKLQNVRVFLEDESHRVISSLDYILSFEYFTDATWVEGSGSLQDISETDKVELEKLKTLIKELPEKDRLTMMQMVNSLQENWFDTREKTKWVINIEQYIENNIALEKEKKDWLYAILDGFIVGTQSVKNEVFLATKVVRDLIPKSNAVYADLMKKLDEITTNPDNTVTNKELAKQILEAVKNDSTIDNKDKLIIRTQLQVIIYGGQANVPVTENLPNKTSSGDGTLLSFMMGFVKIFSFLVLAIVGLMVGLFIYFKFFNSNASIGFQDFLIEKFSSRAPKDSNFSNKDFSVPVSTVPEKPIEKTAESPIGTPIKSEESLSADQMLAPKSADRAMPTTSDLNPHATPAEIPDWLKQITQNQMTTPEVKEQSLTPSAPIFEMTEEKGEASSGTVPLPVSEQASPIETLVQKPLVVEPVAPNLTPDALPSSPSAHADELPAWLKAIDQNALSKEVEDELSKPSAPSTPSVSPSVLEGLPSWLSPAQAQSQPSQETTAPVFSQDIVEEVGTLTPDTKKSRKRTEKKKEVGVQDLPVDTRPTTSRTKKEADILPANPPSPAPSSDSPATPPSQTDTQDLPDWLRSV